MSFSPAEVDSSWHSVFSRHRSTIDEILGDLQDCQFTPCRKDIFKAFRLAKGDVKVVIFGQDPYPGEGVADGLAFSSPSNKPIPASLRNIFLEYSSDLVLAAPASPNLTPWSDQGVMLLNRSLTTAVGERNAHQRMGWLAFTKDVARELASEKVVAILWGNFARELSDLFPNRIESVHPSPLSARNGFFGSKPFSRANELLRTLNRDEVNWKL